MPNQYKKILLLSIGFQLCVSTLWAQDVKNQKVKQYIAKNDKAMLEEYIKFLSVPNVSSDSGHIPKDAAFIVQMMEQRGIKASLLHGTTPNVNPAVYGEITVPHAKRTIGFYAHYDGQPVNARQWHAGLEPFSPVLITAPLENGGTIIGPYKAGDTVNAQWRITARGSADDKAGVMAILNAAEAIKQTSQKLSSNIKFLFEGEEEVGSTHLNEIFETNKENLKTDCWVIIDGPRNVSGRKTIQFGVRGDVNMSLTVYGAKRPLHSGNYGNWAPNPALVLVQLLASMKDENGHVLIKGFYDDVVPLTASEKEALAKIPSTEETLKKDLGIHKPEGNSSKSMAELLMLPTLNISGLQSANVGELKANIIPSKAEAALDLRMVLGNDVERQQQKVIDHITSKGFHVIDHDPTDEERNQYDKIIKVEKEHGYNAQRTSMDLPIAKSITAAIAATTTEPVVLSPSAGGSLPLYLFETILGAKVISVPIANYDNNQHAENENIKIRFLWEGIETIAAIMQMK